MNELTYEQAKFIARVLWPKCHDEFIHFQAQGFMNNGYAWLTHEFIDFDEAAVISEYLMGQEKINKP